MRVLEKIALVMYSYIVLALAVILTLIMFGWLDAELVGNTVMSIISGEKTSTIILVINIVFMLLSVKCIFFGAKNKKKETESQGVLLQNENGKLMISKETIESLVNTIINQFESVTGVTSSIILNKENNLIITLNLNVGENIIIKELSVNLQEETKDDTKDDTKEESKEETKEDSKTETKEDSKEETKEDTKKEDK